MKKNKKITLNKIPSVLKNVTFPSTRTISSKIIPQEGSIVFVEAGDDEGKLNIIDYANGRLGKLWKGDTFPAVLGFRMATTEFAGFVPDNLRYGQDLYLLCESGVVGDISGVFEAWGTPMKVKVLGSILDDGGKPMNLKHFHLPRVKTFTQKTPPLILFLGTRMDSGKTTMACKIGHELHMLGKKITGAKLTGVAFTQDLMKLNDAGISPIYDFVDMGLPSTCGENVTEIVDASLNVVNTLNNMKPDCILVEFGDAVLGEYHVADILKNTIFLSQVKMIVLAANDLAGIKGTMDILQSLGLTIDLVTGPIANSHVGVDLIEKYFHLPAESNQHEIEKTMKIVQEKLW